MTPEQTAFLNLRHFPGVLNREQAALRSGFAPHEIDILSRAGKLTALGKPEKNCKHIYSTFQLERCLQDLDWLNAAQKTIVAWWDRKNKSRLPKHDAATPTPSSMIAQKPSRSNQTNSRERERNLQKDAGKQKRKEKRSDGTNNLNGFQNNGNLNEPSSPNE